MERYSDRGSHVFWFFFSPNSGPCFWNAFYLTGPSCGQRGKGPPRSGHTNWFTKTRTQSRPSTISPPGAAQAASRHSGRGRGEDAGGGGGSRARKRRRRPRIPLCSFLSPPGVPSCHPHTNLQRDRGIFLLLPSNSYSETIDDDQNYFCSRKRLITWVPTSCEISVTWATLGLNSGSLWCRTSSRFGNGVGQGKESANLIG